MNIQEANLLARNKILADKLLLISNYYRLTGDSFRSKAYGNASVKIGNHDTTIVSGDQAKREISGVGQSIAESIDEFFTLGKIKRLTELEEKYQEEKSTIDYFMSFYGIGPKTAIKFYNQGFRSLYDIWHHGNLNDAQKLGILWRDHIELRIPREEILSIEQAIAKLLPVNIRWDIAGSFRREEPSSGDIDMLVQDDNMNMNQLIDFLKPILPSTLAIGDTKFMGIVRLSDNFNGHRIDIRLVEPIAYASALMYFTGSQRFNILMRQRAITMDLTLNEYGLFDKENNYYEITSEQDIFEVLQVNYVAPKDRTRHLDVL